MALHFVGVGAADIDRSIGRALRDIGRAVGADRSYLFQCDPDGRYVRNTHEWCARGAAAQRRALQRVPVATFPWAYRALQRRRLVHIERVRRLPPAARRDRRLFSRLGIPSLTLVPFGAAGRTTGFLGFDFLGEPRRWTPEQRRELEVIAHLFAGALERHRDHRALVEGRARTQAVLEAIPDSIYLMDRAGRFVAVLDQNPKEVVPRRTAVGRPITDFLPGAEGRRAVRLIRRAAATGQVQTMEHALETPRGRRYFEARMVPCGLGQVVVMVRNVTERVLAEQALQQYQKDLRQLTGQLSLAEERQRREFALELHDGVAQELAIARNHLRQAAAPQTAAPRPHIDGAMSLLDQVLHRVQSLTFDLSPPTLYEFGLPAAIRSLARRMRQQHGLKVEYVETGRYRRPARDLEITLFRVVRELMINVVKHARARTMRLVVAASRRELRIGVHDDGRGFHPQRAATAPDARGRHLGLFFVRERVAHVGGRFELDSRPGAGTRAMVIVPPAGASTPGIR